MKSISIVFSIVILVLGLQSTACSKKQIPDAPDSAKTMTQMDYEKLWKEIDSLDQKQLYRSAQEKVILLRDFAHNNDASIQWLKSLIYLNKYAYHLSEDDLEAAIKGMETGIEVRWRPGSR